MNSVVKAIANENEPQWRVVSTYYIVTLRFSHVFVALESASMTPKSASLHTDRRGSDNLWRTRDSPPHACARLPEFKRGHGSMKIIKCAHLDKRHGLLKPRQSEKTQAQLSEQHEEEAGQEER